MKTVGKFPKRTIRKVPISGKTVLLRSDFNVPLSDGQISDDFRIRASLPTIEKLLKDGCKVVIISHLGRPDGEVNQKYSLEPVAAHLAKLLKKDVRFVDDCVGKKVEMAIKKAPARSVIVLENLRFHKEEEANDGDFARRLAHDSGARYFVQDGFGVVHRAHASTAAITSFLPAVAGLLLEKEYQQLTGIMQSPRRPLLALLGGAKVSDKIEVISKLVDKSDQIVLGGAMANTFLAYRGFDMKASKFEIGQEETIKKIYEKVSKKVGEKYVDNFLVLPEDLVTAAKVDDEKVQVCESDKVGDGMMALDIGPESRRRLGAAIERANSVIWNGTLGLTEQPAFRFGSATAARIMAEDKHKTSVIGGGDTAGFVISWDKQHGDSFTHVSTGGGAGLDVLIGKKLPGLEVLLDA